MSLHEQINNDWKSSIKNKDAERKKVLTFVRSKFLAKAKANQLDLLSDEDATQVLRKMAKEQQDFVDNYGGDDAATELEIIESYLPKLMDEEAVRSAVSLAIAHYGHSDICSAIGYKDEPCYICGAIAPTAKDMGKVMGSLMKDLKGKADGGLVQRLVKEALLNNVSK